MLAQKTVGPSITNLARFSDLLPTIFARWRVAGVSGGIVEPLVAVEPPEHVRYR